jgi:hypothetical protein
MSDAEAHDFYNDPDHLAAAGPGQRREQPMKSGMIPVRFAPEVIAVVRRFASQDGVTVSTWIRRLVGREIQRRQPSATAVTAEPPSVRLHYSERVAPTSQTVPQVQPERLCVAVCLAP